MTRKTLSVRPEAERTEPPTLQKRGRGWNIAESRLDTLHETAREMRRAPTERDRTNSPRHSGGGKPSSANTMPVAPSMFIGIGRPF